MILKMQFHKLWKMLELGTSNLRKLNAFIYAIRNNPAMLYLKAIWIIALAMEFSRKRHVKTKHPNILFLMFYNFSNQNEQPNSEWCQKVANYSLWQDQWQDIETLLFYKIVINQESEDIQD